MLSPCSHCEAYNYLNQTIRLYVTLKCIRMSGPIITKFISALRELATYKELIRSQVSGCIINIHYSLHLSLLLETLYSSIKAYCSVYGTLFCFIYLNTPILVIFGALNLCQQLMEWDHECREVIGGMSFILKTIQGG